MYKLQHSISKISCIVDNLSQQLVALCEFFLECSTQNYFYLRGTEMEAKQIHSDMRSLIVMLLALLPETDERHLITQEIAKRNGMVELLNNRLGKYEGGDG